jgi:hypothetical protein
MSSHQTYGKLFRKFFNAHAKMMGNDAFEKRRKYKRLWRKAKQKSGIKFSTHKLGCVCPINTRFLWFKSFPSVCDYIAEVKFPFVIVKNGETYNDPPDMQQKWDGFLKTNKFIIDFELVDGSVWFEPEAK